MNTLHCPFSHQHSCSLFPAADYKSNIPANETFIFSKDKKLCFSDCIGNMAHYNNILIILCANQSPCCASGDLLKESYLWWNLWRPENIENCTMHLFFYRWVDEQILSICKTASKKANVTGLCSPQFYCPCIYTLKKYPVTILKWSRSQWIPESQ